MGLFDFFKKDAAKKTAGVEVAEQPGLLYSPANGEVIPMAELPDPVFAEGMMGKALGVKPEEGKAYAPISGTVQVAMPHAFGIKNDEVEILIHVGVDTVEMDGDGFDVRVEKGREIKAGTLLVTFDQAKVAAAGHPDTVMTIITNTEELEGSGKAISPIAAGHVAAGEPFLAID